MDEIQFHEIFNKTSIYTSRTRGKTYFHESLVYLKEKQTVKETISLIFTWNHKGNMKQKSILVSPHNILI